VQYDTQRGAGLAIALPLILRPGNDIYFVDNHNGLDDPLSAPQFRSLDSRLSSKLLYTYRF